MTRKPHNRRIRNAKVRKDAPAVLAEASGLSGSSILLLKSIEATPLPATGGARKSPAGRGLELGPLIRLGYVRYDADTRAYVPTDKGCDFISRLKATGLLDEK